MTLDIPDDWLPTAANINALPEPVRRYIMRLEMNSDPTLTLQQNAVLRDQVDALEMVAARCTCRWESQRARPRLRLVAS